MPIGDKYGTHRVMEPAGSLPQAAQRLDNDMSKLYDNEILVDVIALNIDSASFTQISEAAGGDLGKIEEAILGIVAARGKQQNPVTGSGGMLIGRVARIGSALSSRELKIGDKIATLVSLSLTPLSIKRITRIIPEIDRVEVEAQAILFETGLYAKLPADMDERLALAALDVAGAPAQTARLVGPGMSVLVLGAGGKSGALCCYEAKKRVGPTGRVIAAERSPKALAKLRELGLAHDYLAVDATRPAEVAEAAIAANGGHELDLCINCVNVPGTEMSSILPLRDEGTVYFFSMATSFSRAALGAEGVGKDVTMIIGNGYMKGHAEITLGELRENAALRAYFESNYVK
jgi:Threonine dehydrogenase and related Zn-dependent dehydrogenases